MIGGTLANGATPIAWITTAHGDQYVAAERNDAPQGTADQFVTWQMADDGATFWGHYFADRDDALADLCQRAGVLS